VAETGDRFGFQLTFFRHQLLPHANPRPASLATNEVWMAHAALSSKTERIFLFTEKFARSLQMEVQRDPLLLRMGSWSWRSSGQDSPAFELRVATEQFRFALQLKPGRGPILQGEEGLSRKGPEPGNASYYYSMTRLPTEGTLELLSRKVPVRGSSWIDREWSTSVLPLDVVGWDWIALELEDGRDLMLYRLRRGDGSSSPESQGVWIYPGGATEKIEAGDFSLEPRGTVQTRSGTLYPQGFRIRLDQGQTELELIPLLADQELQSAVRYWEGAVEVLGRGPAGDLRGVGFLEMTGYADRKSGNLPPVQPGKSSAFGSTPR
jgi:predicted secreted hydrolase